MTYSPRSCRRFPVRIMAILLLLSALMPNTSDAQRLRDKDLVGTEWRMHLDLGGEADAEDGNALSRAALAMAASLISEVDIRFYFEESGDLRIVTDVDSDADADEEYSAWFINEDGNLVMGDSDSFSMDSDTVWIQEEGMLVAHQLDEPNMKASIWLERIEAY